MRALVVRAPGRVEVADVAEPTPGPDDALVAIERGGICGTDLKIANGDVPVAPGRVLGHELVGRVVVAPAGSSLETGARVLVNPSIACGRCVSCRADREHLCPNGALLGRDVDGGFAQRLAVPGRQLHTVPESLTLDRSVLLQVLGVCVHAQRSVDVFPGQSAVVIGLGVSGLLMVQLLRARGIDRIVGVTRSEEKQRLGVEFGATAAVGPDDARAAVDALTGGAGADVVVECVGTVQTIAQAIELAGLGATAVLFGTTTAEEGRLRFYELYRKELTIRNPRAARPRDYDAAVDLLGREAVRVDELLSATYPLERGPEAFATLVSSSGVRKIALAVEGP